METIAKKAASVKNHIYRNRAKYAVVATLAVAGVAFVKRANEWNEFLDEKGLSDEFYKIDEED